MTIFQPKYFSGRIFRDYVNACMYSLHRYSKNCCCCYFQPIYICPKYQLHILSWLFPAKILSRPNFVWLFQWLYIGTLSKITSVRQLCPTVWGPSNCTTDLSYSLRFLTKITSASLVQMWGRTDVIFVKMKIQQKSTAGIELGCSDSYSRADALPTEPVRI